MEESGTPPDQKEIDLILETCKWVDITEIITESVSHEELLKIDHDPGKPLDTCKERKAYSIQCPLTCNNPKCNNRKIPVKKQSYDLYPAKSGATGIGLFASKKFLKGEFLIPFTGEVLTKAEFNQRYKCKKKDKRFYAWTMDGDDKTPGTLFLDPTQKGNLAQLINHACDPNSKLEQWKVDGKLVYGIFAIKKIEAFQEVTISYGEKFKFSPCLCTTCQRTFEKENSSKPFRCNCGVGFTQKYNLDQHKKRGHKRKPQKGQFGMLPNRVHPSKYTKSH